MKLQTLLTQDPKTLSPTAMIVINQNGRLTAQQVVYAPEILNLGAILLGYYFKPAKIAQLSQLGDCLSVGHYVQSPRALKYGLSFANNSDFQKLPSKTQKHLTGEIQDCTIAYQRDLKVMPLKHPVSNVKAVLKTDPKIRYIYLYQDTQWSLLRIDGQNQSRPVSLRVKIRQLLKENTQS